ncbi:MAG: class I SAM-dependent DNA methyltransferase [Ilumatobacteraceae bacterium]
MSTERDKRLQWIYAAQDADDLRERYDVWAADYDSDLDALQWTAPQAAADRCHHVAEAGAEILDAGCGTGLVGVSLAALGHDRIVGFDLSPGMLAKSGARGVYAELAQGSLLDRLPFDDGRFGCVVAVGVFTFGHVDGSAFAEVARVTAARGYVVIAFRDDVVDRLGYREEQQRLIDDDVWELVEVSDPLALLHEEGDDVPMRVWTWRVR